MSASAQRQLLAACARSRMHPAQQAAIDRAATALQSTQTWEGLSELAEAEGLAPLLHKHLTQLGIALPQSLTRELTGLVLRHRRSQALRGGVQQNVADTLAQHGIDALWLKGGVLAYDVYDEPGLRPMRDLDVLVPREAAERAQSALIAQGFVEDATSRRLTPDTHHHLPSLSITVSGLPVHVELHRAVRVRHETRDLSYADFAPRARAFSRDGHALRTLSLEDTLWLVYRHAFCGPLRWEAFRLVWVADLESLVERHCDAIDWELVRARYAEALRILPVLHHLTPLHPELIERLHLRIARAPGGVGETFRGAPFEPWETLEREHGRLGALRRTFLPPSWWMRMHYGTGNSRLRHVASYLAHAYDVLVTL